MSEVTLMDCKSCGHNVPCLKGVCIECMQKLLVGAQEVLSEQVVLNWNEGHDAGLDEAIRILIKLKNNSKDCQNVTVGGKFGGQKGGGK